MRNMIQNTGNKTLMKESFKFSQTAPDSIYEDLLFSSNNGLMLEPQTTQEMLKHSMDIDETKEMIEAWNKYTSDMLVF